MDVGVEFDTLFDHTEGFFVGVWRRTPYDIDSFPFCLNAGFMNDHHCGVDAYVTEKVTRVLLPPHNTTCHSARPPLP
jgi:hypothetical protein